MLNHCTSLENFFLIWKSKILSPQEYIGGDSILSAGDSVIFCFKDSRRLSFQDVIIVLPEETPFETGYYTTFEGIEEPEFYVRQNIKLQTCTVKLHRDFTLEDNFDDFQYNFVPSWDRDFNAYSEENEEELSNFYTFLCSLEQEE